MPDRFAAAWRKVDLTQAELASWFGKQQSVAFAHEAGNGTYGVRADRQNGPVYRCQKPALSRYTRCSVPRSQLLPKSGIYATGHWSGPESPFD
jgi:hypothetical protein